MILASAPPRPSSKATHVHPRPAWLPPGRRAVRPDSMSTHDPGSAGADAGDGRGVVDPGGARSGTADYAVLGASPRLLSEARPGLSGILIVVSGRSPRRGEAPLGLEGWGMVVSGLHPRDGVGPCGAVGGAKLPSRAARSTRHRPLSASHTTLRTTGQSGCRGRSGYVSLSVKGRGWTCGWRPRYPAETLARQPHVRPFPAWLPAGWRAVRPDSMSTHAPHVNFAWTMRNCRGQRETGARSTFPDVESIWVAREHRRFIWIRRKSVRSACEIRNGVTNLGSSIASVPSQCSNHGG